MAVGILCATFSKSQIVCFITSALACFVLYWTMMQEHYASISRGVLDMRDLVFFATIIVVCIVATILTIDKLTRK